jgi:hypothetical protein
VPQLNVSMQYWCLSAWFRKSRGYDCETRILNPVCFCASPRAKRLSGPPNVLLGQSVSCLSCAAHNRTDTRSIGPNAYRSLFFCSDQDRTSGAKLDTSYQSTSDAWLQLYGTPYQRAGTMYLGDPPKTPEPPATIKLPTRAWAPTNPNGALQASLTDRTVFQVCVAIMEARNLERHRGRIYMRVAAIHGLSQDCMRTSDAASDRCEWAHEVATFQAEQNTGGLSFQVWDRPAGRFASLKSDKLLASATLPWSEVHAQPGLALNKTFVVDTTGKCKRGEKPPTLRVAVSITPRVQGPYLFRTWPLTKITDDKGENAYPQSEGRWLTRIIKDHTGANTAVLRTQ